MWGACAHVYVCVHVRTQMSRREPCVKICILSSSSTVARDGFRDVRRDRVPSLEVGVAGQRVL